MQKKSVKVMMSYLRLAANTSNALALDVVINMPTRGIGVCRTP